MVMDSNAVRRQWLERLSAANSAANAWFRENAPLGFGSEATRVLKRCEQYAQNAKKTIDANLVWTEKLDRYVASQVEGIYVAIEGGVPKWTDPFAETVDDLKEGAADLAKPAAFGVGLGVVLLGAAYLYVVTR